MGFIRAAAGPGPSTLAYLRHLARQQLRQTHSPFIPGDHFTTSSPYSIPSIRRHQHTQNVAEAPQDTLSSGPGPAGDHSRALESDLVPARPPKSLSRAKRRSPVLVPGVGKNKSKRKWPLYPGPTEDGANEESPDTRQTGPAVQSPRHRKGNHASDHGNGRDPVASQFVENVLNSAPYAQQEFSPSTSSKSKPKKKSSAKRPKRQPSQQATTDNPTRDDAKPVPDSDSSSNLTLNPAPVSTPQSKVLSPDDKPESHTPNPVKIRLTETRRSTSGSNRAAAKKPAFGLLQPASEDSRSTSPTAEATTVTESGTLDTSTTTLNPPSRLNRLRASRLQALRSAITTTSSATVPTTTALPDMSEGVVTEPDVRMSYGMKGYSQPPPTGKQSRNKTLSRTETIEEFKLLLGEQGKLLTKANLFWKVFNPNDHEQFNTSDWQNLSHTIARTYRSSWGRDALRQTLEEPNPERKSMFRLIKDMALQAAIRDHWSGLFELCLACLHLQQPEYVDDIFIDYRRLMFAFQGKKEADLESWDRESRLQARLVGFGLRPMTQVWVAALSALDNFSGHTLRESAKTRGQTWLLDPHNHSTSNRIRSALQSWPDGAQLADRYRENYSHVIRARSVEHPEIIVNRIRQWSKYQPERVLDTYQWILRYCKGPNPLFRVIPWDMTVFDLHAANESTAFTMTRKVWVTFIHSFLEIRRYDLVAKLFREDLPPLDIVPRPAEVATFVCALKTRSLISAEDLHRTRARQAYLDILPLYWQLRFVNPESNADDAISTLDLLDLSIDDLREEYLRKYSRRGSTVGAWQRSVFIERFLKQGWYNLVLDILSWPAPEGIRQDATPRYWGTFFHHLFRKRVDIHTIDEVLNKALPYAPPWEHASVDVLGAIAAHHIDMGVPVAKALEPVFVWLNRSDAYLRSSDWTEAIKGILLRRFFYAAQVTDETADAAYRVMERYIRNPPERTSYTDNGAEQMIWEYISLIAGSSPIESDRRMYWITRAFRALSNKMFATRALQILGAAMNTVLDRGDKDSLTEAVAIWKEVTSLKGFTRSEKYHTTLRMLASPRTEQFKMALVRNAFKNAEEELPFDSAIWRRGLLRDWVERAGIGVGQLDKAIKAYEEKRARKVVKPSDATDEKSESLDQEMDQSVVEEAAKTDEAIDDEEDYAGEEVREDEKEGEDEDEGEEARIEFSRHDPDPEEAKRTEPGNVASKLAAASTTKAKATGQSSTK